MLYIASLFVEYRQGEEKASERFNDITRDVSRISLANLPRTQKFYDEILVSLGNVSDIAGIQLTYGNELILSYPKDMKDLNNIKGYLVASRTTKVFASNGIPVNIHASIYKLKPSSIFYKGRIAFIVILAATIVTGVYLIVYVRNGSFPTEAENDDLDEDEIEYPDVSTYDLTAEETSEINSQLSSLSESDMEENQEENSSSEDSSVSIDDIKTELETTETNKEEEEEEDVLAFLDGHILVEGEVKACSGKRNPYHSRQGRDVDDIWRYGVLLATCRGLGRVGAGLGEKERKEDSAKDEYQRDVSFHIKCPCAARSVCLQSSEGRQSYSRESSCP